MKIMGTILSIFVLAGPAFSHEEPQVAVEAPRTKLERDFDARKKAFEPRFTTHFFEAKDKYRKQMKRALSIDGFATFECIVKTKTEITKRYVNFHFYPEKENLRIVLDPEPFSSFSDRTPVDEERKREMKQRLASRHRQLRPNVESNEASAWQFSQFSVSTEVIQKLDHKMENSVRYKAENDKDNIAMDIAGDWMGLEQGGGYDLRTRRVGADWEEYCF